MYKYFVFIALLVLSLNNSCFAENSESALTVIRERVHLCINNNLHRMSRRHDCSHVAEKALTKYPASNALNWSVAEMVRKELGNQISLKYFLRALKGNVTEKNCIHDGMDFAVRVGLDLPYDSFKRDADIAADIVFKYCWPEFKQELIALSERNPSSYWLENVCRGAQHYKKKAALSACIKKH